jgi:DEAD/DEAH box helicase domain-containing protein
MPVALASLVEELRTDAKLGSQLVEALHIPGEPARYAELGNPLPEPLRTALAASGVGRFWSHQAEGLEALRRGENVLVTTPTASGKSLIFQLPVLEEAARGGAGRALFLYPLKALGQDQKAKLDALAVAAGLGPERLEVAIYDGDTPRGERRRILAEPPRVVISNPDMLHLGILPSWQRWEPFLADLRWVVLDELHTYRGIFGCHFHHVLQRLDRVCRAAGSSPRLVASSATAENAGEFARALAGAEFRWIRGSGAPREGRHLLLFQPAGSPYTTTLALLVHLIERGLKTIVFTKARRVTELLFEWLKQQSPKVASRVANYRSGFLAEERRDIERALFEGRLDGVISTSALEMGIDVGGLDACILVGFPGSIMATWQRSGRVGRSGRESVTALVALPDALDQYYLARPDDLVGRPCEQLIVDPRNEPVASAHLQCAAAERPLTRSHDAAYLDRHQPPLEALLRRGDLVETGDGSEIFSRRRRPHRDVNLRGGGRSFTVVDKGVSATAGDAGAERVVGTVDGVRVLHECHLGAIYLHAGRQYLVRELDFEGRRVRVEPVREDYFTSPLTAKQTEVLEILDAKSEGPLHAWLGRLRVTERVVGFERRTIRGQEVIDRHDLDLPPVSYETVGFWWAAPAAIEAALRGAGSHFMGSLHAAEHTTIALLPLVVLCDRGDIGGISTPIHPQVRSGAVFIYDGHPGGVGIAERGFRRLEAVLASTLDLLERCPCEEGCPSCVVSPKCGNGNRPLDKAGAARFLRLLLARETPREPVVRPEPEWESPDWEPPAAPDERAAWVEGESRPVWEPALAGAPSVDAEPVEPSVPLGHRVRPRTPLWLEPSGLLLPTGPDVVPAVGGEPVGARARRRTATVFPRPPRPRRSVATVLFDLETQRSSRQVGGWPYTHRMLLAVGVVCHLQEGRFETFFEDRTLDLIERLDAADLVVGFNIRRFDYEVLSGYTGIDYNRKLPTLDLLEDVHQRAGRRIGLGALTRETLGVDKSADGLASVEWVREGRLDLVEQYCRRDVEIMRDLYLYGRRMGFVLYRDRDDRVLKLRVDW